MRGKNSSAVQTGIFGGRKEEGSGQPLPLLAVLIAILSGLLVACGPAKRMIAERQYRQGIELYEKQRYEEAALAFRKAIQRNPNWGEPYFRLALCDLKRGGEMSRAMQALRQAMALMPENTEVKIRLAALYALGYLQQGGMEESLLKQARAVCDSLLRQAPDSFEGQILAGQLALIQEQPEQALAWFEKARNQKRDSPVALAFAGIAYLTLGRTQEGERDLREALERNPSLYLAWERLYRLRIIEKRVAEAESVCRERIAKNPDDARARLMLAGHFLRLRKTAEMEAALEPLAQKEWPRADGPLAAGDFYRSIGRFEQARGLYEAGLKKAGEDAALRGAYRKRLAGLLLLEGKREEAEKAYLEAAEDAPKDRGARASRALLLLEKDAEAALKEFRQLSREFPADARIHHTLGLILLASGKPDEARDSFRAAAWLQRNFLEPRLALARLAAERQQWRELQQAAADVLALDPRNLQGRYFRALAQAGLGLTGEARKSAAELLRDFPRFVDAQLLMARLELADGRVDRAGELFRRAYEQGRDIRALEGMVQIRLAQRKPKEALSLIQAELARAPKDDRLRLLTAQTALQAGDLTLAIRELTKLRKEEPPRPVVHLMLAEAHEAAGDRKHAGAVYEEMVRIWPKHIEALLRLAYQRWMSGAQSEASSLYRRVLEIEPNSVAALNNLAFLLSDTGGNLEEALELARRAVKLAPKQPDVMDTLGWILFKKGELDSALQIFGGLASRHPEQAAFRYHYGAALLKKGQKEKAKAELQAALANRPPADMENKIRALLAEAG